MKKILEKAQNLLQKFLEKEIGILDIFFGFAGMIVFRSFLEQVFVGKTLSNEEGIVEYLSNFFFFALTIAMVWLILSFFLHLKPQKLKNLVFWGLWMVILPSIIDMVKTGGSVYWSFYILGDIKALWGYFYTIFGNLPSGIVYFGTKITFILGVSASFLVVYLLSKSLFKAFFSAFFVYLAIFLMGSFPSWFTYGYYLIEKSKKLSTLQDFDAIQLIGTPGNLFGVVFSDLKYALSYHLNLVYYPLLLLIFLVLFFLGSREKILAMAKNARIPQLGYHAGLLIVGLGMGFWYYPESLRLNVFSFFALLDLIVAVWLAWLTSVVVNDIYDFKIDQISNNGRPLQKGIFSEREYLNMGIIFFALSLLGGLVVGVKFMAMIFIYQFIAWTYLAAPYRLKKFPVVATFFSAVASVIVMIIGFCLASGDANLALLPMRIPILFLVVLTFSLPIKDLKDIEGDRMDGIYTIPVIFGEEKGRLIIGSGVFASFVASVFILNELNAFWWAIIFGAMAFLTVISKKIKAKNIFWPIFGIVSIYGLILVKIVFL